MDSQNHIDQAVNHLFRQESGKMVSVLIKMFGIENMEMAEDVVQDALISALENWKYKGLPNNPKAWLYRVAKNKAIDVLRRKRHSTTIDFSDPERKLLSSEYTLTNTVEDFWREEHMKDDFLAMMYACCHPGISQENQITFILKSLCGFSTKEVAKSFLTSEDTISKRLYRTKEYFRKNNIKPRIPNSKEIEGCTAAVVSALYLLFNEGYNSTHSDNLIRKDLIFQAMVLCKSLLADNRSQIPEANALMALMCFHASRVDSRITQEGGVILLPDQDRSRWNLELIDKGNEYLNKAAFGDRISNYHLEAAIAYHHCIAKSYETTNWKAIISYYDLLLKIQEDPIVGLNRVLAILELKGPKFALSEMNIIGNTKLLQNYYLYHAGLGEIYYRLEKYSKAVTSFQNAMKLTQSKTEQKFLKNKIANILN